MPPSNDPHGPQEPNNPPAPAPAGAAAGTPHTEIDLGKILLPKKEAGPNVDSAQRINAGALLAQEAAAELPKPESQGPVERMIPEQEAGTAPPEQTSIQPLQTYKGDLESVVSDKNVSMVSIAAAEAERRGRAPLQPQEIKAALLKLRMWAMVGGGALLVVGAIGVVVFVLLPRTVEPIVAEAISAPLITVDGSAFVSVVPGGNTRAMLMNGLQTAKKEIQLSVGLVAWLYVAEPPAVDGDAPRQLTASELLGILAPNIPPALIRVLEGTYVVGVHSFDENQAFMLLRVDSYETAYAGMLAWEQTMRPDLLPFFNRNPSPQVVSAPPAPVATSTGTSTAPVAPPIFINSSFVDKVVENRDVRLIQNSAGDILLLWTFLGRNTILVTTNEYTMREVLSRLKSAPVVPIPGR